METDMKNEEMIQEKKEEIQLKLNKLPEFIKGLNKFISKQELVFLQRQKYDKKARILNQIVEIVNMIFMPSVKPKNEQEMWLNFSKFKDLYKSICEF